MSKQIQWFITRTNRAIREDGLMGISGVRFDRGGTPMDVLKSKQYSDPVALMKSAFDGTPDPNKPTLAQVAEGMNSMQDHIDAMDGKALLRKRKNNGHCYGVTGYLKPWTDEYGTTCDEKGNLSFNDGTRPESQRTPAEVEEILNAVTLSKKDSTPYSDY